MSGVIGGVGSASATTLANIAQHARYRMAQG
jgi:hypothetical protein